MSDTQNPATENNDANCNCCANTDGRNVVNVCSSGNTLYIGCMPAACACQEEEVAEDAADETPAEDTNA